MQKGELAKGGSVAEKSFIVLVLVGVVEVCAGFFSLSIALVADGALSFADAVVSLIVWTGLTLSKRAPDGKFHFGYYRVETFSSVVAAFFMAILGAAILYESYSAWVFPRAIVNAEIAMIVALLAAVIALIISIYKKRAAAKYGSLALKTDSYNSIKDVLTSVTAFLGITFSRFFQTVHADSIAGIIIALFVFTVAYSITREASLVLMDACQCEDIILDIQNAAEGVEHVQEVHGIRMRKLGPYLIGDMHVVVEGDMTVKEADQIAKQIEEKVKAEFDTVFEIKVRIEPPGSEN